MSTSLRMRESDVHGVNLLLFNHKGNLRSSRVQRLVTPLAPPTLIAGSIFFSFFFFFLALMTVTVDSRYAALGITIR